MTSKERYRFKVGTFDCLAILDGKEKRPITTLTESIPQEELAQVLREHGLPADEVMGYFNCLFVDTGEAKILVDAGWGRCTDRLQGRLLEHLQTEGITPADVDLVIFTHGDRDHMAGVLDAGGKLAFPKARYLMSREGWEWYSSKANLATLLAEITLFYRQTLPLLKEKIELVEAETEPLSGVQVAPAPGHRAGHQALIFSSAGERLVHLADAVGHPLLMEYPEWRWPFDSLPEQALQTRKRLLDWAVDQKALVFGSHLPFPGLGTVARHGHGWRWQPLVSTE